MLHEYCFLLHYVLLLTSKRHNINATKLMRSGLVTEWLAAPKGLEGFGLANRDYQKGTPRLVHVISYEGQRMAAGKCEAQEIKKASAKMTLMPGGLEPKQKSLALDLSPRLQLSGAGEWLARTGKASVKKVWESGKLETVRD